MELRDAPAVAAALRGGVVRPRDASAPGLCGMYAWWAAASHLKDAQPPIPLVRAGVEDGAWSLLYVGIGPKRAESKRSLADRLRKDHRGKSIGSSTFRQSIAALLLEHLGLEPKSGYDRSRLMDESPLTDWIDGFCGLSVVSIQRPWEYEEAVIRDLNPPLNLRPGFHPFRHEVSRRRGELRRKCGLES